MTPEVKLRTLAAANVTLQGYFGTAPFRVFEAQVPQDEFENGTCARYFRVSTVREYSHGKPGLDDISLPRFQLDILDYDPEVARAAMKAVIDFLGTCDFAADYQFGCPVTTPPQAPVYVLNQRSGMEPQLEPPVFVQTLDFRFYNLEN